MDKLKKIEFCAKVDPNASINAIAIAKLVNSLMDFIILPEHIEPRWIELKGDFEKFKDTMLLPLLKDD